MLQQELAVEPMPALQTLYGDIVAGRLARSPAVMPIAPPLGLSAAVAVDFVGREEEWQQLNETWAAVRQGNGRILLITAAAGGGKTRLVHEWVRTLPEVLCLHGACYESTRTLAYHPWLKILEQLSRRLDTAVIKNLPAPWLDALSRLLPDFADHAMTGKTGQQIELFTAVHALLNLAPDPFVLFVDDWQWADAASLQLLHFLVERELPVLLIGAYRTEEAEDNPPLLTLLHDWERRQDIVTMSLAPLSISRFGCSYAPGDKVIQTVSNYEKDVFNGDIGQVTQVDPDHGVVVVDIEWRLVTYEFGELDEVALAYTATVHKSQGSEYLAVIIGQPRALGLAVRTVKSRRRLSN
jgi:hypothetical protein